MARGGNGGGWVGWRGGGGGMILCFVLGNKNGVINRDGFHSGLRVLEDGVRGGMDALFAYEIV